MGTSDSGPVTGARGAAQPATSAPATARVWVQRAIVGMAWLAVLLLWRRHQTSNDLGAADSAQQFIDDVGSAWWGVVAYVAVYLARPIVLFPASVLTVVGGVLFGPYFGVLVVVVAANASAMVAFGIGRLLGRRPDTVTATSLLAGWAERIRTNSFETVLTLRLLYVPYDLVNYAAGALHVRARPFLLATALGSVPGTVSFVLIGASLDRVDDGFGGLEPAALIAGLAIFVVSLTMARLLRRRTTGLELP
ncbi:MAG: TVP38/TMEM64 family protein [Ilumatobacter sp.]|nr:TVP38/TMEM64 family protein [Ilumatobacter sp.]